MNYALGKTNQLSLFRKSLPRKPYCTDYIKSGLMVRAVSTAVNKRYIQPNHVNSKLWLLYDIDRPFCVETVTNELNLPTPTIFIQNPENNHAHLLYALQTAVHLNDNSSAKAIRFAGAVDTAMTHALEADAAYAGLITKNPLHEHWRTYTFNASYDLADFAEYVDLQAFNDKRKLVGAVGLGRNCDLFDKLRRWSYQAIKHFYGTGNQEQWFNAVLARSERFNCDFQAPLLFSEVKSVARSVAKYVWRFHDPNFATGNRGRDALEGNQLNLAEKQVLSATVTNRQRRERTEQAIVHAVVRLQAANKKVTQKAVAELSKLSTPTIKRYWNNKKILEIRR